MELTFYPSSVLLPESLVPEYRTFPFGGPIALSRGASNRGTLYLRDSIPRFFLGLAPSVLNKSSFSLSHNHHPRNM